MLLSWRERLLIGLMPSGLVMTRMKGLWHPRMVSKQSVSCDPGAGPESWRGAATALKTIATALRGDTLNVTVVLSNNFVRYAMIPWSAAVGGGAEGLAYARHCFNRIHGERTKSWTVSSTEEAGEAPRLACAIDTSLLAAIRGCFENGHRSRLISVQPYLMAAFNCWRRAVPPAGTWLLILEADRTCLALHAKNRWQHVANVRGTLEKPEDWVELIERERHRTSSGETPATVLVHTVNAGAGRWPSIGGLNFERLALPPLEGYAPSEDSRYGMALMAGQT